MSALQTLLTVTSIGFALETARYIRFMFWTWWSLTVRPLVGGLNGFPCFSTHSAERNNRSFCRPRRLPDPQFATPHGTFLVVFQEVRFILDEFYNDNDFYFPLTGLVGTWGSLTMLIRISSSRSHNAKWM